MVGRLGDPVPPHRTLQRRLVLHHSGLLHCVLSMRPTTWIFAVAKNAYFPYYPEYAILVLPSTTSPLPSVSTSMLCGFCSVIYRDGPSGAHGLQTQVAAPRRLRDSLRLFLPARGVHGC